MKFYKADSVKIIDYAAKNEPLETKGRDFCIVHNDTDS